MVEFTADVLIYDGFISSKNLTIESSYDKFLVRV